MIKTKLERVLGKFEKGILGPNLIFIGGIHGNEPAGIQALESVLGKLETYNPRFKGCFLALNGNLPALEKGKRFIEKDLNRLWKDELISSSKLQSVEEKQQIELAQIIENQIQKNPNNCFIFDLHTTSSESKSFTSYKTEKAHATLKKIPSPIISNIFESIDGVLLNYYGKKGIPSILFEAGQHKNPNSVEKHEAFIWLILESLNCISSFEIPDFERYKTVLEQSNKNEKGIYKIVYSYKIKKNEQFVMLPGFENFQKIQKNQTLAQNQNGDIKSPMNGKIFMPLYQKKGRDGFFIINNL